MRSFYSLSLVFLFLCSPGQTQHLHKHEKPHDARHRHKRYTNGAFTYFDDGEGACGIENGPNDFIVALNAAQFDGGAHCFDMITIIVNGQTAQAQITDECMGCPEGGLDFSRGLFQYFAPLSDGEIYGLWAYNSDLPTSSSTPQPTSTSSTPARTSTTPVATTTTSAAVSPTISITSTTVSSPASTASSAPTPTPQNMQTIAQIELALVELGAMLQVSFEL